MFCLFIRLFICLFVCSFINYLFLIYLFIYLFIFTFIRSFNYLLPYLFACFIFSFFTMFFPVTLTYRGFRTRIGDLGYRTCWTCTLLALNPRYIRAFGGRNSSVGSVWARCPQRRGFDPPLGTFSVEGIFPLELTWVQTPFPKNSFG